MSDKYTDDVSQYTHHPHCNYLLPVFPVRLSAPQGQGQGLTDYSLAHGQYFNIYWLNVSLVHQIY